MAGNTKQRKQKGGRLGKDQIKAAVRYGIDVSMLIDNVKRSPAERIKRHQIALNTAEKLRSGRLL